MSKKGDPIVVDFETEPIEPRPARYPPVPTGVSLWLPEEKEPRYLSWGHPEGNNISVFDAERILRDVWRKRQEELLFHNGKYDTEVAQKHFGLDIPPPERVHDTMFQLFLTDPYAVSFGLKPAAKRLLKMPEEERDEVFDWCVDHKLLTRAQKSSVGTMYHRVPGDLLGRYANGDTRRTLLLHRLLYPQLRQRNMLEAYNRERKLMPILLENEQQGIRVDVKRLFEYRKTLSEALDKVDAHFRKLLGAPDLNMDADAELAKMLEARGLCRPLPLTAKGHKSTSKESLAASVKDPEHLRLLVYRGKCAYMLRTFIDTWAAQAEITGDRIHTQWNQVRQSHSEGGIDGTRTGRMSSKPSLLNVTKKLGRTSGGYVHPKTLNLPELPHLRSLLLPDEGGVWCRRDMNQQELRLVAHFENGDLMRAYQADPRLDVHEFVRAAIEGLLGFDVGRDNAKTINFGMLYGLGLGQLAIRLGKSVDEARTIKQAQLSSLPGLDALNNGLKNRARHRLPIRTWGGREYYAEEPRVVDGRLRDYAYKLLNYLIQGSGSDVMKEVLIRYHHHPRRRGRFLLAVHDEKNSSAPKAVYGQEMQLIREVVQSIEIDVLMLSDGEVGPNWGTLEKFVDLEAA